MYYYKTEVQYDGTNYAGFQWQPNLSTIQNELNLAISRFANCEITTMGTSRTDSGVHALSQIVKITSKNQLNSITALEKINLFLPLDIKLLNLSPIDGNFRPNVLPTSKEYLYLFTNIPKNIDENDQRFIANFGKNLNIELIENALKLFLGKHNFYNFYSMGSNVKNSIRTINQIELSLINPKDVFKNTIFETPEQINQCYQLRINGDGFLKQMIRHIVSSLWMIGTNKISYEDLKIYLEGEKQVAQLWKVAPPNGLFLSKIIY